MASRLIAVASEAGFTETRQREGTSTAGSREVDSVFVACEQVHITIPLWLIYIFRLLIVHTVVMSAVDRPMVCS